MVSGAATLLIVLAALLLLGAALLIIGLTGRRIGSEPHCRRCGYDLTGQAERCPECGREAHGKNIVIGVRQRRWRLATAGTALLLISCSIALSAGYGAAKGVNWYIYLPESALVFLAEGDNPAAIKALVAGYHEKTVPGSTLLRLVPLALERQGTKPKPKSVWAWADLLSAMDLAGGLTPEQRERFRDQLVTFSMKHRSRVRRGEELSLKFEWWTWGSAGISGNYRIEDGQLRIGATLSQDFHFLGLDWLGGGGSGGSFGVLVATGLLEPGTYPVELRATKVFENPSFTRALQVKSQLTVLPADGPDPLQLTDDPGLVPAFKKVITFKASNANWGHPPDPDKWWVEIQVSEAPPMDAAFTVLARIGETEHRIGSLILRRAQSDRHSQMGVPLHLNDGDCFVPILRTDVAKARQEADLFEIWNGELFFEAVCVKKPDGAATLVNPQGESTGLKGADDQ